MEGTMKSSSSPNADHPLSTDDAGRPSLSRVLTWSIIVFFVLQTLSGVAVIVFFIGGAMTDLQHTHMKSELTDRKQNLDFYLNSRLSLLQFLAKQPAIITGTMNPTLSKASAIDTIDSFSLLEGSATIIFQDFQGNIIHSTAPLAEHAPQGEHFAALMQEEAASHVDVVTMAGGAGSYWRLALPIRYQGRPEGVLTALIPMFLGEFTESTLDEMAVTIVYDGVPVFQEGKAAPPVVVTEVDSSFPGITLRQEISSSVVNRQVTYLVTLLAGALVGGTVLIVAIVLTISRRAILVPHEKLQALSAKLEEKVQERTRELQERQDQLTIEVRERAEAEMVAREGNQLVSALLAGIGGAFYIIDPKGRTIIRSNSILHGMFFTTPEAVNGQHCASAFAGQPADAQQFFCPGTIETRYCEGVGTLPDGSKFPLARYLVPMEIQGEDHIGVILMDITERKNLERRLNTAQKLESIGELATGIAHEINTPIQFVSDSVRFIKEAFEDISDVLDAYDALAKRCRENGMETEHLNAIDTAADDADLEFLRDEFPKACDRVLDGTERVAKIVRSMKNFAHPGEGTKKLVDINQALENTIIVAKNEWKYVADLTTDFGDIPLVHCLPGDINQVFLNILINAAHAIEGVVGDSGNKGHITLSTTADDGMVTVAIADTGSGIPQQFQNKIFDPFFTTKEVGKGTGQGLAIAHDIIVERHNGQLDFTSTPDEGTTFFIKLPIISTGPEAEGEE
jgi:signal transduction histidine kinase